MHFLSVQHLISFFARYGYWTVLAALLLEDAGLPLPGETVLLVAGSTAATSPRLHLAWVIVIGIAAAATGDNVGYWIGRSGGRALLNRYGRVFHVNGRVLDRGERWMREHGAAAVFGARFVAGLRVVSGLLAGSLSMPWRRFFVFNLLGATVWVSVICSLGYLFGSRLQWLVHVLGRTGLVLLGVGLLAAAAWWWFRRRRAGGSDPAAGAS